MRKSTMIRKATFTLAAMLSLVLAVFFCNSSVARAEGETGEAEEAAETEEVTETEEKELVQCSDDWIIFQYLDDNGNPMFDVRYLEKRAQELETEHLKLQYRTIYQNDEAFEMKVSSWYGLDAEFPEETKTEIEAHKTQYYIQFRVVSTEDQDTAISKSYTLLIYPQEEPFPYIVSANIGQFETYDLATEPNELTVTLKYNDRLIRTGTFGIDLSCKFPTYYFCGGSLYIMHYSIETGSEKANIDGKDYTLGYTNLSFDLGLPTNNLIQETPINLNYLYTLDGIKGFNTQNSPGSFMLNVSMPPIYYVEEIRITSPSSSIKPGKSIALTANVLPENADNTSVSWYSSNEDYATVDEDGVVTAKAAGAGKYVTITAYADDYSGVEGTYTLYIEKVPTDSIKVSSIKLSADKTTIPAGGKVTVKAKVAPSNATNPAVAWKSSNTRYATVNTKGVVTTKAAGAGKSVTITATAKDQSGKKASIKIKIARVKVSSIKLSAGSKTVKAGKKITVKAKVLPANATTKAVTWKSSNKKYATVSSKGVVTAKKAGKGKTVTITAEARDGSGKKGTIKIKIK